MEQDKTQMNIYPLEIDVVFYRVLRYIYRRSDVFSCRQVCRTLVKCNAFKLLHFLKNNPPQITFKKRTSKELQKYSSFHTFPRGILVNFRLEDYSVTKDATELQQFFNEFGHGMKHLILICNPQFTASSLIKLGNLLKKCQNLESLIIRAKPEPKDDFVYRRDSKKLKAQEFRLGTSASRSYQNIFRYCPKLKKLSVGGNTYSVVQYSQFNSL